MYACIVKAKIKEELWDGHRPTRMKGTPVGLSLKAEGSDDEEGLTDRLRRVTIE